MRIKTFSVKQIIRDAVTIFRKDSNGYFRFGDNDSFPNELVRDVNASGTAKSCIIRLDQFTQADGFIDRNIASQFANPKQTFDDILAELSMNIVYSKCVSFRVFYNNSGQVARLYPVPFTQLRRKGVYFVWNENFGNRREYKSTEDKIIHEYDPNERPESRMQRVDAQLKSHKRQIGDLVYFYKKTMESPNYPIPDYYSEGAINDIRSDASLARVDNKNISKGFRTPVIISTGPIDDVNKDENNKSALDYFSDVIEGFVGEDAAPVLHLQANTPEEMAKVTTIPLADVINATTAKREDISKAVCRHFNVPPPIIGIATPGELGNNQQLINQIKFMGLSVNNNQRMIANALKMVFPDKDFTISTLKLIDILPDSILAILTEEEKRQLYDLPAKPQTDETIKIGV